MLIDGAQWDEALRMVSLHTFVPIMSIHYSYSFAFLLQQGFIVCSSDYIIIQLV